MNRTKLMFLFLSLLVGVFVISLAGCGGDDDNNNPTGAGDTTPPGAVTDLALDSITANSVQLNWTVPADPAKTGTTTKYDIRYSSAAINDGNWPSASQISGEPDAGGAGSNQRVRITGLTSESMYYFAMKAGDAASNWSALSNVVSGTTLEGEDDTTGTGGDTLTTQEVVDQVQETFSSIGDLTTECETLLLLDPNSNADEFLFMLGMAGSILGDTLAVPDTTLADFYGTWDDTDEPGNFEGVVMTSSSPDDAFVILLASVDTTGAPISGNLTISALERDINVQARTITISASMSINQDGGESVSFDFSLTMDLSVFEGEEDLEALPEIMLTMSGEICGLEIELDMETTESGQVALSGYYEYDSDRISFEMETDIDEVDTCATFEVWEGASQVSTEFYLTTTICNSDEDCVTGSVEIEGVEEITFWAEECASDSPEVYMNINGETLSGEEVFDELAEIFNLIWGIDLDDLSKVSGNPSIRREQFHPIGNNPALIITREILIPGN